MLKPELFICPRCKSDGLIFDDSVIRCPDCQCEYKYDNGKYCFLTCEEVGATDPVDKLKSAFKRHWRLYTLLIKILSPVCPTGNLRSFLKRYVENKDVFAINLGSGNSKISDYVYNADLIPYDNVHFVCDMESLPFANGSVDVIINSAVLEHVPVPEAAVQEIHRVLRPGGLVYSYVPFIVGFHASPHDYSRWTLEGLKVLYGDFDPIMCKCAGGPTSGFLWVFQEWISLLLSFGIRPLHTAIYFGVMVLTFPLKFVDWLLIHHPLASNISSGFVFIGRKPPLA